jgi:hypothetical protein
VAVKDISDVDPDRKRSKVLAGSESRRTKHRAKKIIKEILKKERYDADIKYLTC